ncbi:EF-hand domain-containing protein, partial [Klebsiella pneumoniae]|nr:EF-hand domain-containing protein [Klebsiella pneumoniae]
MAQSESISAEMEALSHVLSLVEVFRSFDSNNDGQITAAELGGIMGSLGYNPREQDVKAMMQQGDTNKDGLLSLEEFLEMNTKGMELGSLASCLQMAFQELNGDE